MKKLITITTIVLLFASSGCRKDLSLNPDADKLYTPYLTSVRGDGEVTLKWGKPACELCGTCPCPGLDPKYFEILISDSSPAELKPFSTVKNNIFEVTINNLTNGTPYYFAIIAIGQIEYTVSETIMVIPAIAETK